VGQDVVKTLSRVLCGSMLGDIVNSVLKDGRFNLQGLVHSNFIEGFGSRIIADFLGFFSERVFNGETTLLGIPIPKLPAEFASQLFTNPFVHLWRFYTNDFNVNKQGAEKDVGPEVKKFQKYMEEQPFTKLLKKASVQFGKYVQPSLEKFLELCLGVKGAKPILDEHGKPVIDPLTKKPKKTVPLVNWWKLGTVSLGSLVATAFLPKDTQQYGFTGIYQAESGLKSLFRFVTSVLTANVFRYETTYFRNVLGMNRNGYSPEACSKATVREKMLLPSAQYFVDGISALLTRYIQKVIPINGATLSMMLRLPFELIANLLSSSLVGISSKDRVPLHWAYLGTKYWKPAAKVIETVLKPFNMMINVVYKIALRGIMPSTAELEQHGLQYREYGKENHGDEFVAHYKNNSFVDDMGLFLKSINPVNLFKDLSGAFGDANRTAYNGNGGAVAVGAEKAPSKLESATELRQPSSADGLQQRGLDRVIAMPQPGLEKVIAMPQPALAMAA